MNKFASHISLLLSVLLFLPTAAFAQSLKMAGWGETHDNKFQIVYLLDGVQEGGTFSEPSIEGATFIHKSSPVKIGESTQVVISNGRQVENSSTKTFKYTVTYRLNKTGNLQVGPASVTVGGKKITASGFRINVSKSAQQQAPSPSRTLPGLGGAVDMNDPFTQTADKPISSNDLYVRIEMSKPQVYEQEAVVCTIKLYTKFPIRPGVIPLEQPSFDGFLIEELNTPGQVNVERVNGQNYYTIVFKKCILYPQKSGRLTIKSGVFDITPVQRDIYVGINSAIAVPHDTKLTVKSNSATVNILPLPEPRPAGFTGAVGDFKVSTSINPHQLKTYSPATYNYVVQGKGNIKYVKAPEVNFPKEFDTYDPQSNINTKSDGTDVFGNVTFAYSVIPQFVGNFELPASQFIYFNPTTAKYETIDIPAMPLHVEKGKGQPSSHYKNRQKAMTDVHPIMHGDLDLKKNQSYLIDSLPYWLAYALPLLALVAIIIYNRKRLKEMADMKRMRTKRAGKVAQKRLKRAKAFATVGKRNEFYGEVLTAMWGYMSDKLGIPVSDLSKDNIASELERYGVGESLRNETLDLLEQCEFAQYAPELAGDDMMPLYDKAAQVMEKLESVKPQDKAQIMRSLVIVIMALLGSSVGVPLQAATATAVQADSAYAQERYHDALGNYQLMMQEQGVSSKLFYNMGNTYYKINDYAHAIICYEKALMLDPTCTQARENLEFVNQKLKLPVAMGSRSFVTQVAQSVAFLFTSNGWAIVALITFILCLIAVAIYVFRREVLWRKLGFFSALALLVLTALAITCSLYLRNRATNSNAAIVVSQSATLSTAPRTPSASEVAFKLPLGSKVEVNDSVATKSEGDSHKWYQVQAANGRIAWIDDDDVELLKI
jgi:tetratricopeptide (TPR) repeat protein